MRKNQQRYGFTIVELLIVIVVIAILAAITIIAYNGLQDRASETAVKADLKSATTQVASSHAINGRYPSSKAEIGEGKGIQKNDNTYFQYSALNNGEGFCLTATPSRSGISSYHVSNTSTTQAGACTGHAGSSSTLSRPNPEAGEFILVPGNPHYGTQDFFVAKYEARKVNGKAVSQPNGTPWIGEVDQAGAIAQASAACSGCQLITDPQWMTIAMNVISVDRNWTGGAVGNGQLPRGNTTSIGAMDGTNELSGATKRTLELTNGEVIWDFAGNLHERVNKTITGNQPGLPTGTGYQLIDYDNPNLSWNGLDSTSRPTGTLYSRNHGVGTLNGNPAHTQETIFLRGGSWGSSVHAGVWALQLNNSLQYISNSSVGFRVSH